MQRRVNLQLSPWVVGLCLFLGDPFAIASAPETKALVVGDVVLTVPKTMALTPNRMGLGGLNRRYVDAADGFTLGVGARLSPLCGPPGDEGIRFPKGEAEDTENTCVIGRDGTRYYLVGKGDGIPMAEIEARVDAICATARPVASNALAKSSAFSGAGDLRDLRPTRQVGTLTQYETTDGRFAVRFFHSMGKSVGPFYQATVETLPRRLARMGCHGVWARRWVGGTMKGLRARCTLRGADGAVRRVAVHVTDYMDGQTAISVWGDGQGWKAIEGYADAFFKGEAAPSSKAPSSRSL